MKSRGFGITNMFFFMSIFIIFLLIISILVHGMDLDNKHNPLLTNNSGETNKFDYSSIEKQLKTAAILYQKDYYPNFNDNDYMYVSVDKLISLDYLNVLTDGQVSCKGYARITYDNVVDVEPFIKCGSYYETEGYSATFVE